MSKGTNNTFDSCSFKCWTLYNAKVKDLCKGAKVRKQTYSITLIISKRMEKIKLNGENWTNVVNANLKSGSKLEFEDGYKCVVVEYYKAHYFKKGSKTALKIKVGKDVSIVETDKLRSEHCPEYKSVPHKTKVKTFQVVNLEIATKEELENLKKEVEKLLNVIYAKELKEKKRQEVLNTLTPEQREALGL